MSYPRWPSSSGSYSPVTYIRGVAVDVTMIILATHILSMLVVALLYAFKVREWEVYVVFQTNMLGTGYFWTLFSYPFYHDITHSNLFFAIEMLMFFWFGREVERFIGRNGFIWFYVLLVIIPPVVMMMLSPLLGPSVLFGSSLIHFAVFIGFVTIYPNVQFFFGLVAKWLAVVFLALYSLINIGNSNWNGLAQLWVTVATGYLILRYAGVGGGFAFANSFEAWKEQKYEEKLRRKRRQADEQKQHDIETVDVILEKISREGIHSLSSQERRELDQARQRLVNRDKFKKKQ